MGLRLAIVRGIKRLFGGRRKPLPTAKFTPWIPTAKFAPIQSSVKYAPWLPTTKFSPVLREAKFAPWLPTAKRLPDLVTAQRLPDLQAIGWNPPPPQMLARARVRYMPSVARRTGEGPATLPAPIRQRQLTPPIAGINQQLRIRRSGRRTTGTAPNIEIGEKVNVWVPVGSSWIAALRFVPVGVGAAEHLTGYIDMRVKNSLGYDYRYGDGNNIYLLQFKDWRTAASRGKYWWYRWTKMYSPAVRITT